MSSNAMSTLLADPFAQLVMWLTVLAIVIVLAVYVVGVVRARSSGGEHSASDMMSNFRELHSKGELDDEEFRTIKGMLGAKLRNELNRNDENG